MIDRNKMKKMKPKKKSPFEYLKDLTSNKVKNQVITEEYLKDYEPTVINKILSMNFKLYPQLLKINTYSFAMMPKEMHYKYLHATLPKQFLKFDYVKGKKNTKMEHVKYIEEYYECGKKEALMHVELLSKEQLKKIKDLFRTRI
jgi:hypothetical protein